MVLSDAEVFHAIMTLNELSRDCQGPANEITVTNLGRAVSGGGPLPVCDADYGASISAWAELTSLDCRHSPESCQI